VHGHGGILLEHLKWLGLHFDVRVQDRLFWHTSTSWIMWNVAVSALLLGSAAVIFDGDPLYPTADIVWELPSEEEVTCLGMGASLLVAYERAGLELRRERLPASGEWAQPDRRCLSTPTVGCIEACRTFY
jgi:acetoacetyl-CoA synthetase